MKYSKIYQLSSNELEGFKKHIPYTDNLYEFEVKEVSKEEFKELEKQTIELKGLQDYSFSYASVYVLLVDGVGIVHYLPVHKYELLELKESSYPLDKALDITISKRLDIKQIRRLCKIHILYKIPVDTFNSENVDNLGNWLFGNKQEKGKITVSSAITEKGITYVFTFPSKVPYIAQLIRESIK